LAGGVAYFAGREEEAESPRGRTPLPRVGLTDGRYFQPFLKPLHVLTGSRILNEIPHGGVKLNSRGVNRTHVAAVVRHIERTLVGVQLLDCQVGVVGELSQEDAQVVDGVRPR
jgi:hypothetical protein